MQKRKRIILLVILSIVVLGELFYITSKSDNIDSVESRQSENSVNCSKDDFEMNLYTDKKEYKTTDKINMWGTIKYVGKKDKITIYHAGSVNSDTYIYYSIDNGENFHINSVSNMMGKTTLLTKDKLYHFDYQKSGSWDPNGPDAKFWEDFYKEKDLYLPKGEYTITAESAFSLTDFSSKAIDLKCILKIKVVD